MKEKNIGIKNGNETEKASERKKTIWMVATFENTFKASKAAKILEEEGFEGGLIPVPREIKASCGTAWRGGKNDKDKVADTLNKNKIEYENIYEVAFY
jgi:hypothetical protein